MRHRVHGHDHVFDHREQDLAPFFSSDNEHFVAPRGKNVIDLSQRDVFVRIDLSLKKIPEIEFILFKRHSVFIRFSTQGCRAAGTLAQRCTEIGRQKNNKYFYAKYKDKTPKFISMKTIGDVTDFRYFYDNSRKTATMTKGSNVYIFRANDINLERGSTNSKLKYSTKFSRFLYLDEDDAKDFFGCTCEYVDNTSYGVCLAGSMESKAGELLSAFSGDNNE